VLATLPRALAYATSLLRDRSLADDVVHDCYLRLLQKEDTYDLLNDGTKLLFRAVTNACVDRNSRERMLLSLERGGDDSDNSTWTLADGHAAGPLDEVMRKEFEAMVASGLERLPVAQRAALELRSLGYSLAEVGEALGTTADNAGVLIHRARKRLAGLLAGYLGTSHEE
jgi:RNA polymerase sigma-70 factor (ECF subfamily)